MYDPGIGRWLQQDPIGFRAGDANLYRYVGNKPTNMTDPSGLAGWGRNAHCYPLHLGGSGSQPVIEVATEADHLAMHRFLARFGFGIRSGDVGRAAWARLTLRQQLAFIIRAMRAGGIPNRVIRDNIAAIMRGATPGHATVRPPGFPGGRVIFSAAVGAIAEILINPGTASAAEVVRGWRGLPASDNRLGHVEMTDLIVVVDEPRSWNLFGTRRIVSSTTNPAWLDLGEMAAHEARELEGLDDSWQETVPLDGTSPSFGYYRMVYVYRIVRFNGQE